MWGLFPVHSYRNPKSHFQLEHILYKLEPVPHRTREEVNFSALSRAAPRHCENLALTKLVFSRERSEEGK